MIGQRLGHYQIVSQLGKGGMGEVYLAEDTRLDRRVAVKVLPERLRNNPERLERFRREAKAAANLNHPNIATIHSLEEIDDVLLITMEYVDGRSLKDVISDGGMDVGGPNAVGRTQGSLLHFFDVFLPLADALVHAHGQGRIHRDLKPGNIMIAEDGTPKILDFGLARIIDPDAVQAAIEASETAEPLGPEDETRTMNAEEQRKAAEAAARGIHSLTRGGVLIGTPHYMSPEQAEREDTDARTDIFSFGVVMYEALTGQRPFEGKTLESIIGRIVEAEPQAITELKPVTPHTLWSVIRKCLVKDRNRRMQTAQEMHHDLQTVHQEVQSGTTLIDASNPSIRQSINPSIPSPLWLQPIGIATAVLALLIGLIAAWTLKPSDTPTLRKLEIVHPNADIEHGVISPDGTKIIYRAGGRLWIRDLDRLDPYEVIGPVGRGMFWSPSSAFAGYFSSQDGIAKLMKVPARGGSSIELCELGQAYGPMGGAWRTDDTIVFVYGGRINTVPAGGGVPEVYLRPDSSSGNFYFPDVVSIPGSQALLLRRIGLDGFPELVYVNGAEKKVLIPNFSAEQSDDYSSNDLFYTSSHHLIFERDGDLFSLPVDPDAHHITGEEIRIAENATGPSVSSDGTLIYMPAVTRQQRLALLDRSGSIIDTIGQVHDFIPGDLEFSPDERRIALRAEQAANSDIWIHDVERPVKSRVTSTKEIDLVPIWSPDGKQMVFSSNRNGPFEIYRKTVGSNEQAERLPGVQPLAFAASWSVEGNFLLYHINPGASADRSRDIWYIHLSDGRGPVSFLATDFDEGVPRLSPDGRYVAYQSDESGRLEVYVRRFPSDEDIVQVSIDGGISPRWRSDGKELYFVHKNTIMAVSFEDRQRLRVGVAEPIIDGDSLGIEFELGTVNPYISRYDVSGDGRRFIGILDVSDANGNTGALTVVQNWLREFEEE